MHLKFPLSCTKSIFQSISLYRFPNSLVLQPSSILPLQPKSGASTENRCFVHSAHDNKQERKGIRVDMGSERKKRLLQCEVPLREFLPSFIELQLKSDKGICVIKEQWLLNNFRSVVDCWDLGGNNALIQHESVMK